MIIERFLCWVDTAPEEKRVQSAGALAKAYLRAVRNDGEQELAEAAISVLLDDPSADVRYALAHAFAYQADAPRHVIMSLAADTVEIATLVLVASPVFLDSELVEIVAGGRPEAQIAIACRSRVSPELAAAIAEGADADACRALLANPGAEISGPSLHRIAERFGGEGQIRQLLLRHDSLRPRTRVLLIDELGAAMETAVREKACNLGSRVGKVTRETSDKAVIAYAAQVGDEDLAEITESLIASGRMTTAFLLRSICMGNISLFASALSVLGGMPQARVEAVLANDRRNVLRVLCRKAGIPEYAFAVFASAIDVWRRLLADPQGVEPGKLAYRVTREILASYRAAADPRLDPLLALLRKLAAEAAREHARREAGRIAQAARLAEQQALPAPEGADDVVDQADAPAAASTPCEPIDLPEEVVTAFAYYFAEEIVDLEEQQAALRNIARADAQSILAVAAQSAEPGATIRDDSGAPLEIADGDWIVAPETAANDDVGSPASESIAEAVEIEAHAHGFDEPASTVMGRFRSYMGLGKAA